MSLILDGSNGVTFPNGVNQSLAGLPLTGGQLSGNLTFATGTNGIIFNKSGALTNSTLNDYEEGTWTPDVVNNGKTSSWTTKNGIYRKVGNLVWVCGQVDAGASGATAGGALILTGLPFNVATAGSANYVFGTSWCSTQAANAQPIAFYGGASNSVQIWNTNLGSQDQTRLTTVVLFSFNYYSA